MDYELINYKIIQTIIQQFNYIDGITSSIDNIKIFFDYLNKIKLTNKEENGEVLTNINLLLDLFNKFEQYSPNIYKKKLKWFDTSAGCGLFFIILYYHLIQYHTKEIILNEMLYFSEINKNNVNIIKLIFNGNNNKNIKLNIYFGDTLQLNIKNYFKINKFDCIVHNPPFNSGAICSTKRDKHNNQINHKSIWIDFIIYSFKILKKNGFMLSITPNTFYRTQRELHNEILEKQLLFIINYDNFKSKEIFNVSIPISIYLLKNINNNNTLTNIISYPNKKEYNENLIIDFNKPLSPYYQNIFYKLYDFVNNNNYKFNIIKKNSIIIDNKPIILKKEENKLNKNKFYSVYTYTIKDGIILRECKEDENQFKYKICFKNQRCLIGGYITNKFSICGRRGFYILDNKINLIKIKNYIDNFKLPLFVSLCLKYSQSFIDDDIWLYIPNILLLKNIKNELDLLKLIGLNEDEINIILNFKGLL